METARWGAVTVAELEVVAGEAVADEAFFTDAGDGLGGEGVASWLPSSR